jgi:LruC domain-containing protein
MWIPIPVRPVRAWITLSVLLLLSSISQAADSIQLTDVIKSNGTGNIDLFKDVTAAQLEALRVENGGQIVLAVDVNEDSSGTESSTSQGVSVKAVTVTIDFADGSQNVYDSSNGCCTTETQALLAEDPSTTRLLFYTLLGESGSNRITANNVIQEQFDSTLKIEVPDSIHEPGSGIVATSAVIAITLLDTNTSLGDPEAFYDYSNGFEDLALLNAVDTTFVDDYAAGRDEAPTVILTNPPSNIDPLAVSTWNYFPSASSYYLVAYEDLYPNTGDYDFNDLTAAYQVRIGLNSDGDAVAVRGTAYLVTRGAAYSHDWHLRIGLPGSAVGSLTCTTFLDPEDDQTTQPCSPSNPSTIGGETDIGVFSDTLQIFTNPLGSLFVNTNVGQPFTKGPKSTFSIDLDSPIAANQIAPAPFDPYLFVINTGENIQLAQVNPIYKDPSGYPFGMLLPSGWHPPTETEDTIYAYPEFRFFVSSDGLQAVNWYDTFDASVVLSMPPISTWAW